MKYFIYFVIFVVGAAVIAGFFIVGSPQKERLRQFDERRVGDLNSLQSQIVWFWQNKGRLPNNLSELKDDIGGYRVPQDPETGAPYGYEKRESETFVLCATFNQSGRFVSSFEGITAPKSAPPPGYRGLDANNWEHGAGYTCFERIIDKDLYKPRKID